MAQSTGKEIQQIEELNRKKAAQTSRVADLDRERNEAKQELDKITTIPKIAQRNMNEIEIQPILKNFAYVRILYDTMANEYFYEAIEPKLTQEESELLDVLKEILVESLELL